MGTHITKYKKEDGKIRKDVAETKKANRKGAAEPKPAEPNKPASPAHKGA